MGWREDRKLYATPRWQKIRKVVKDRDGWRCTKCGKSGFLEVHHDPPVREIEPEKFFDPEGLFSVCRSCHIELTRSENLKRHAEQNPKRAAWQKFRDELLSP